MTDNDLCSRVRALPLFARLVEQTLPALSGAGAAFELVLVGVSDVPKASSVLAVLRAAATAEVAVVWVPNSVLREEDAAELNVHVYPRESVVVSTSAVVQADGAKYDLILVLPDGQTASGTREVRLAVGDATAVGSAAALLRRPA